MPTGKDDSENQSIFLLDIYKFICVHGQRSTQSDKFSQKYSLQKIIREGADVLK